MIQAHTEVEYNFNPREKKKSDTRYADENDSRILGKALAISSPLQTVFLAKRTNRVLKPFLEAINANRVQFS
jgi:hypothetical protein